MKQFVSNACGTVGLLHAIGNNTDSITLSECGAQCDGSLFFTSLIKNGQFFYGDVMFPCPYDNAEGGYLKTFFDKTKDMTPEEKGEYLEEDEVRARWLVRITQFAYLGGGASLDMQNLLLI